METSKEVETKQQEDSSQQDRKTTTFKELTMMAASSIEDDGIKLTEKQVDEILANRCKITDYIHKDKERAHERKMRHSYDSKYYFTGGAIVWLIIFIVSMLYYKEQILTILVSTGTFFGGYGFGAKNKSENEQE